MEITIVYESNDDGSWIAWIPEAMGAISEGVAREEARSSAHDRRGHPAIAEDLYDATWPTAKRLAADLTQADNGQIERSLLIDLRRCYPNRNRATGAEGDE